MRQLFIDGFAGGGGASTGIAQAIGRNVDIAINHSPSAIAIHKANHPDTEHHCQDIRAVWPKAVTRLQPVAGAWFSPDCKEYSKAKGGPVKDRHIRALSNEVTNWLREVRPAVFYLENVEEYEYAAPLDDNGVPIKGLEGFAFKKLLRTWRSMGYRVEYKKLRACDYGAPTSRRRLYVIGRCDKRPIVWPKATHAPANDNRVLSGDLLPYRTAAECIDWSIPCPSIFERARPLKDATMRRIAHGVMRYVVNAGRPFIVPVTHSGDVRTHDTAEPLRTITTANGGEFALSDVKLAPHITKFHSNSVGSPMEKEMPTVTANGQPKRPAGAMPLGMVGATLVRTGHGDVDKSGKRRGKGFHDLREVAPTVTSSRDEAIAVAHLEKFNADMRPKSATDPLDCVLAGSARHANVTTFLSRFYGSDKTNGGGDPKGQIGTVRAGGQHHGVVCAHIEQANTGGMLGRPANQPLTTITTRGTQQRIVETTMIEEGALPPEMMERAVQVAAFLVKFYGTGGDNEVAQSQAVDRPLDTVTTKARFAVVTVTIDAVTYVIVDIGLRMLKPRELARAQGFPDDYVLDPIVSKLVRGKWVEKPLTIAEQISAIGNSVCPPVARALVGANQPELAEIRMAA
ncbi:MULTISPECIES: DNA cytosine methyltransferase [unclassified Sphingobium]|uniref:DNA cytosine methyltransferase n=1 Tax=unclassified Sphingobium TaxID=2611147 RepID=UPI002224EDA2|nr:MULTISPECIES: DNA cytosine methyltransferase [unclassified Sphingobium]MCW2395857.1 DNA (cytosine-5)-methyltransferase 1 [Sphingobium sp. B8D3B]MCW2419373.1 DNA (cytosine-5)-methyltransferase 1 [Sphingobium sp. B8D3C]